MLYGFLTLFILSLAVQPACAQKLSHKQAEESCLDYYDRGKSLRQGGEFVKAYDTLRKYIETCYAEPLSYHAFKAVDGANSQRDTANIRYLEYREWLKSVLYLNTEVPKYWCADVGSIFYTFNYIDPERGGGYTPSTSDPDSRFPGIDFVRTITPYGTMQSGYAYCGYSGTPPPQDSHGERTVSEFSGSCLEFLDRGKSLLQGEEYRKAYDTLRAYIETCYADPTSYRAFGTLDGANSNRDTANVRYLEYREWLKSVLYLNTEVPKYWCADVGSILNTFNYIDPERGFDINGIIAVIRFAEETGKCPTDTAEWHKDLKRLREIQFEKWEDTAQVGSPEVDTTIPTLEELGLEILRGPQGAVKLADAASPALISAEAVRNPFTETTALRITLGRLAVVDVKVYDQMGRVVLTLTGDKVLDATTHELPIDATTWSKGTYYARVSTLSGDVQTVKLIVQ